MKIIEKILSIIPKLILERILPITNLITSFILIRYGSIFISKEFWLEEAFPYKILWGLIGMSILLIGLWLLEIYYHSSKKK